MSVFTTSDRAVNDLAAHKQATVDPNSMLSSHKAPEYVRQLDKQAMKNAMEEALLRHEKEISVRQLNQQKHADQLKQSIDKELNKNELTNQARRNLKEQNRKQLIEHYHLNQMQREHDNQQQLNDKRTYFGPDGLTTDQERAILKSKKAQQK